MQMEASDYRARVSKRVKEYSKKAKIKGFRPGSIPEAVIRQMYGRSILMEEVNDLFVASLTQYLQEQEIQIVGAPIPVHERLEAVDWERQHDFEFEYLVGIVPPFTCELSKDIQVTAYKIGHVTEQAVDALVAELRQIHGQLVVVDESADSDIISGELHYPAQDFRVSTQVAVEKLSDEVRKIFTNLHPQDKISLDVKQMLPEIAKLPGVTEKLNETMRRLGGTITFTVEEIYGVSPAAVEQGLFDKILGQGVVSSEKDFREKLKIRLSNYKQEEADAYLNQSIQAILIERAAIVLPENFMKYWLQGKDKMPEEQEAMHEEYYARDIRWLLLIKALSKAHNIQVTYEEIIDEIRLHLQASFEGNAAEEQPSEEHMLQMIQDFMRKNNGENSRKLYERAHMYKLINAIKEKITITTQQVSDKEFDNLVSG